MAASPPTSADDLDRRSPRDVRTSVPEVMRWQPVSPSKSNKTKAAAGDKTSVVKPAAYHGDVFHAAIQNEYHDEYYSQPIVGGDFAGCDSCAADQGCESLGCDRCHRTTIRFWARAEYLYWTLDGMDLPPLVTSSPAGTAAANVGLLGNAGTTTLFGNGSFADSFRSGGRIMLGVDDLNQSGGFEVSAMLIAPDNVTFHDNRDLLARPVFDTITAAPASMLIAHPDFLDGNVRVEAENRLFAFGVLRRHHLSVTRDRRLDFLLGYRYARLDETLRIDQSSTYTAPQGQIISGTMVDLFDHFEVENHFHGGEIGLQSSQSSGPWKLHLMAKVGLGVNTSRVSIDGATTNTVPGGGSASFVGGLLAQQTNIGRYKDSEFTAIPEVAIAMSHRLNAGMELWAGYNFLYWQNAARLSGTIDRSVSQFPPEAPAGTGNPAFRLETDDFTAHGLSAGATFAF